ncbi:hypothetical protein J3A83DRAFT_4190266 [Scleroderma citrinum]
MAGLESPPPEALNKVTKSVITQHIKQLTFSAAAFTLWTRNFELVKLKCRDVQFDNTAIDGMFLKYLQVGTNGVLQPGKLLSHDTMQKWIGEATVGAGIWGMFSTHCFHCGGAQYQFMFAPIGPISQEANISLTGEGTLTWPTSTEALCMAHASLTADVAALHKTVNKTPTGSVGHPDSNDESLCELERNEFNSNLAALQLIEAEKIKSEWNEVLRWLHKLLIPNVVIFNFYLPNMEAPYVANLSLFQSKEKL